jgi:hypothetical protein
MSIDDKGAIDYYPKEGPKFEATAPPEFGDSISKWNYAMTSAANQPELLEKGYTIIDKIDGVQIKPYTGQ